MISLEKFYSEEDKLLLRRVVEKYSNKEFDEAIKLIHNKLEDLKVCQKKEEFYLKIELAGFLIDIGEESRIKEVTLQGLGIIEYERANISGIITEDSIEYNLGNAKSTLFKIEKDKPEKYIPKNIDYLIEAKNHYWKAYKYQIDGGNKFSLELVVNLANALSSCGRVVESLQYYDLVLKEDPNFPQANASRSKELIWLKSLSGMFTQNLVYQAKIGYEIASRADLKSYNIPKWLADLWKENSLKYSHFLSELNYDEKNVHKDKEATQSEFNSLSSYRQFCIVNHLTLSEHSLYCNCIGSRRDDIIICTPFQPFDANFIPVMEKILNRLKSEYSLARMLYYYSKDNSENEFTSFESEVMFTELYDSESIGTKTEMLRTSFRLCFGILDKIASAICKLYDLADANENIYFERFWNPDSKKSSTKQKTRWEKINSIHNFSLLALYTQATDLNNTNGEWSFFKSWRNALEHNLISLLDEREKAGDIFEIYQDNPDLIIVDKEYFNQKTIQLLQFTRSAIFNYVFMVRNEAYKVEPKEGKFIRHTFTYKNDKEENE